jgi:integrase
VTGLDVSLTQAHLPESCTRALRELAAEGASRNTDRGYAGARRYLAAWYAAVYGRAYGLPVPRDAVLAFIAQHAQRRAGHCLVQAMPTRVEAALVRAGVKARSGPLALSTIEHRLAVLSADHRDAGLPNPCHDPLVRRVLRDLRRAYAQRGALPRRKDPICGSQLQALLATCEDSLRGQRDRALLWFAWSTGGLRRSDVAGARLEHLVTTPSGGYTYHLTCGKNNRQGEDRLESHKHLVGEAAAALGAWLHGAGISSGPIFRRVMGHSQVGPSLSADAVNDIVHKRCRLAGLEGDLSAHSLRSGFVSTASIAGVSLPETMALTGHRSTHTLLTYTRVDSASMRHTASKLVQLIENQ